MHILVAIKQNNTIKNNIKYRKFKIKYTYKHFQESCKFYHYILLFIMFNTLTPSFVSQQLIKQKKKNKNKLKWQR